MNKKTFSIEFSFDVDAGTIELLDDDKWCVNQLITPEVFIERYADEVAGQTWEICDSLFKIRRFVITGDEDKYDILVTDDGKAWVHRQIKLYVVGENPEMPTIEINSKIEKQLNEYTKGNIAGISPECTRNEIVSGIR